jgi:hypothetical protein
MLKVIQVSPEGHQVVSVAVEATDIIRQIKEAAALKLAIPADEQVLVFKGRTLLDSETVRGAGLLLEPGISVYAARLPMQNTLSGPPVTDVGTSGARGLDSVAQASMASFSWLWEDETEDSERKEAEDEAESEKVCRICHEGSERAESGRLFSPCSCAGSMRFVHVDCLNQWRAVSTNSNSNYRCDQCHYEYNLQRTDWASAVQSAEAVEALTAMVCVLLVLIAGVPSYVLNTHALFYDWVEWTPPWYSHQVLLHQPILQRV